jgi:hypothetical protein
MYRSFLVVCVIALVDDLRRQHFTTNFATDRVISNLVPCANVCLDHPTLLHV